jgi:uncharacterized protein (DUF2164 family)
MASAFSNYLQWTHTSKLRVLDWITYAIIKRRLGPTFYQGLVDSLNASEGRSEAIGKWTVMPSSFIGGQRDMRRRYMDAMALVRRFGKLDIFLTMTCNPKWDEITCELYPGQTPQDHLDLIDQVFRAKLEEIKHMLIKRISLKRFVHTCMLWSSKRGVYHTHIFC